MQNRKVLLSIGIIIAIAVVLFGGVYAYQRYANPKSEILNSKQIQDSNSETAGWKTYTNAEYGFELSYPVGVSIREDGNVITVNDSRHGWNFDWDMKFYKNTNKEELNTWINYQFNSFNQASDKDCKIVPADKYGVRINIKDVYTLLVDAPSYDASCGHVGYYVISPSKSTIMNFDSVQSSPELYQDILSTFNFTK